MDLQVLSTFLEIFIVDCTRYSAVGPSRDSELLLEALNGANEDLAAAWRRKSASGSATARIHFIAGDQLVADQQLSFLYWCCVDRSAVVLKRMSRYPIYQIDFSAVSAGKHVASTKRRIKW